MVNLNRGARILGPTVLSLDLPKTYHDTNAAISSRRTLPRNLVPILYHILVWSVHPI